jgi:hypothetical protein
VVSALLLATPAAQAQLPNWDDVHTNLNNSVPAGMLPAMAAITASAPTASGDLIVAGVFMGSVSFGSTTLRNTATSGSTSYVARYSPATRRFVWAQQVSNGGGPSNNRPNAVAVSGNTIYVGGNFNQSDATFGAIGLSSAGGVGAYVAKLSDNGSSGTWAWAELIRSSTNTATVAALAVDGNRVYAAGGFRGSATFGSISHSSPNGVYGDVFVARLTDAGSTTAFDWVQPVPGNGNISAQSLALNQNGLYLAGSLSGSGIFGSSTVGSASGRAIPYVAKLLDTGAAGAWAWATGLGSSPGIGGSRLSRLVAHGLNLYATGTFSTTFSLTNGPVLSSAGNDDIFVTRLADIGAGLRVAWAVAGGGPAFDSSTGLAVQGNQVLVSGNYIGATTSFGATALRNPGSSNTADMYLARLDDAGTSATYSWALSAGSPDADFAADLTLAGATPYLVGSVAPPATFSGAPLVTSALPEPLAFVAAPASRLTATTSATLRTQVQLFPNPSAGLVRLVVPAAARVQLHTALSQVVPVPSVAGATTLDLRHLPRGFYSLRVQLGPEVITKRLVLE